MRVNAPLGEQDRICLLVLIGARPDGTKELAVEDGYRESSESWSGVLRDLTRRGMRAPALAIGTEPWASGPPCATCGPRPGSNETGCTES